MDKQRFDIRLPSIKVVDVVLAALQAAFAQETLFDNQANPYRFVRDDPTGSKVWVCVPDERMGERDGKRMVIQVSRGDYSPSDMGLNNRGEGGFSRDRSYTDLASAPIYVGCEAGSQVQSEILASICYSVLKIFREDLQAEFDIHSIKVMGISPSTKQKGVNGDPWVTTVTLKIEVQEIGTIVELANHLNMTLINGEFDKNTSRVILALDSTVQ